MGNENGNNIIPFPDREPDPDNEFSLFEDEGIPYDEQARQESANRHPSGRNRPKPESNT